MTDRKTRALAAVAVLGGAVGIVTSALPTLGSASSTVAGGGFAIAIGVVCYLHGYIHGQDSGARTWRAQAEAAAAEQAAVIDGLMRLLDKGRGDVKRGIAMLADDDRLGPEVDDVGEYLTRVVTEGALSGVEQHRVRIGPAPITHHRIRLPLLDAAIRNRQKG